MRTAARAQNAREQQLKRRRDGKHGKARANKPGQLARNKPHLLAAIHNHGRVVPGAGGQRAAQLRVRRQHHQRGAGVAG